jgi:hypothetical protein
LVESEYTIDRQRIVAHGIDSGGKRALRFGVDDRDLFRAGAV